jgi:hypothetical protein
VATPDGLRLYEHLNELTERPPLAQVLAAGPVPLPAQGQYDEHDDHDNHECPDADVHGWFLSLDG